MANREGSIEGLKVAARLLEMPSSELPLVFYNIGRSVDPIELEALIDSLLEGARKAGPVATAESLFTFRDKGEFDQLISLTVDEKQRAGLSLLFNGATSSKEAIPGRILNGSLPGPFNSRNIRTPLGRLIEIGEVEQIANPIPGGHPFYSLTPKGSQTFSELGQSLRSQLASSPNPPPESPDS